MILHVVFFKFKNEYNWKNKLATMAEAVTKTHPNNIDQILMWFCGRNISFRDQAGDFCLIGLFKNQNNLNIYMTHEDHQRGVDLWKKISSWNIIDIELEESFFRGDKENISEYLTLLNPMEIGE